MTFVENPPRSWKKTPKLEKNCPIPDHQTFQYEPKREESENLIYKLYGYGLYDTGVLKITRFFWFRISCIFGTTVDGRNPANQFIGSLSHYLRRLFYMSGGDPRAFWTINSRIAGCKFLAGFGMEEILVKKSHQNLHHFISFSRWWFQISFIFTPIWGNDPIWRSYFSDGWFNHQPANLRRLEDDRLSYWVKRSLFRGKLAGSFNSTEILGVQRPWNKQSFGKKTIVLVGIYFINNSRVDYSALMVGSLTSRGISCFFENSLFRSGTTSPAPSGFQVQSG